MNPRTEPPVRSIGTDPAAFTQFYRAHVDDVTRFVARRVADPHQVADLTAQVFLAVIDAAQRYRGSFGGPRTWLYGIARNVIAAEFRRAVRERRAESLVAGRRLLDADDVDHLVEKIDAARRVRELHAGLQALPEGERAVLELVAVDGLSVAEAAAALNIRQVTARVQRAAVPQQRPAMSWPPARIGLAAATAAAAAVAGALGAQAFTHSAAAPASAVPGAKSGSVHIHTAAFTVDSYSDGTIHVTWNKNQYQDSASLQQALRAAGFPVLIREGVFCMGPHDNGYLDPSGVGPGVGQVMQGEQEPDGSVVFVFTPSAMPHGDELFIGYLSPSQLAVTHGRPGSVERLVPTNAPLTCTTQPPPANIGHQS